MALHFHKIPIILRARLLRTIVTHYTEYTKNVEYAESDDINYEKCRTTIALLESGLRQIKEAKEDLQKLYREILDEYKNCEDSSEKRDILAEIHQIAEESDLHISIAKANDLIAILTARSNESRKILENMKVCLEYPEPGAQKVGALTGNNPEIAQNIVDTTEQNRNYVSFSLVSQPSCASKTRCNPVALLKEENAANAYIENKVCQTNNGRVIQSRAKHTSYRPNYGKGCIFCHKGNHSPIQCRTVSNQHMRRKTLKEQNLCWKCFSSNHNSFVCRKQDCSSCGQKHHSSLCFKKGAVLANYGKERRAIIMASKKSNLNDWQNRDQKTSSHKTSRTKPTTMAVQMCTERVLDSNPCTSEFTNKQIVLMTADGSIWNAKRQQFEKVLFCFDSGAQKTVIEEELAEQFGLPKVRTQMCIVSGSGGHLKTFESHTISLRIGTAFGEEIEITGQTRPVITSGFPSLILGQSDGAFLKANDIYLASTKIRGEHQIPRILVGLDHYHDLITGHLSKTPSGLHIAKTVFGPAVYGSGFTEANHTKSVSYNLTAVYERVEYRVQQKNPKPNRLMERQRGKKFHKNSGKIFHACSFTTSSLPSKEAATDVAKNHFVAVRRLRRPQLQPSAVNSNRRRSALHAKPPSTPSSRRSPPTPAIRRRPPHPRAVFRHSPRQEVDTRHTRTRKKTKPSDLIVSYDYSCRSPEYHRHIDDPYCTHYRNS
ncbi:hypothetical protein Y032_0311g2127 [Ancylostoma ceylanicum]|uniref:Peptidase A2 domain-containing protein n=1 Tax=Ancylostoma ceylanicum TaxID=53326 RepID=A0A016S362_9BILA|nr:hypothetical protein Y032_0311g2127 [Ancylostoma ceylanicum]